MAIGPLHTSCLLNLNVTSRHSIAVHIGQQQSHSPRVLLINRQRQDACTCKPVSRPVEATAEEASDWRSCLLNSCTQSLASEKYNIHASADNSSSDRLRNAMQTSEKQSRQHKPDRHAVVMQRKQCLPQPRHPTCQASGGNSRWDSKACVSVPHRRTTLLHSAMSACCSPR